MVRSGGSDNPRSDLVVGHPGTFPARRGYCVGSNGDAEALHTKREEHREASAWHGSGLAALGLKLGAPVSSRGVREAAAESCAGDGDPAGAAPGQRARARPPAQRLDRILVRRARLVVRRTGQQLLQVSFRNAARRFAVGDLHNVWPA